jgi:hypothetical protein
VVLRGRGRRGSRWVVGIQLALETNYDTQFFFIVIVVIVIAFPLFFVA